MIAMTTSISTNVKPAVRRWDITKFTPGNQHGTCHGHFMEKRQLSEIYGNGSCVRFPRDA
jgi:hypothetical protein